MKGLAKLLVAVLLLLTTGTWSLISTVRAHAFIIKPAKAQRARFEKFSKTLIVVEASDRNYENVLRHRLGNRPYDRSHGGANLKFTFGPETVRS
jgi:hypothetical protein